MGRDLTEGSVYKAIAVTSLPMIVAFSLQSAFNIVDAYFVGKISADALAAVSVSFPIVFLLISLSVGVGVGATSLIARFIGSKKLGEAGQVAEHALVIALVLAALFTVSGLLSAGLLFDLMGVSETVKQLGLEYINVILIGSTIMLLVMVGNGILRGEGEMVMPMIIMASSAVLNIILDPILIFTLGWGVRGAAIATVLARATGLLVLVVYFLLDKPWVKIRFSKFRFNLDYVRGIFSVGLPSSLSNVSMSVGMFVLMAILASFGTEALAAFGVGFRLDSLALLPAIGVSTAVVTLVGQNVGAGKYRRAEELAFKAGFLATAFMIVIGAVFMLNAESIVKAFNTDQLVVEYGVSFLTVIPLSYLIVGFSIIISRAFLGSGHALPALALSILRAIVLNSVLAYMLSRYMGVTGVWIGIVVSSITVSLLAIIWFKRGSWKKKGHALVHA